MALTFETINEVVEFINGFDGEGLVVIDDDLLATRLRRDFDWAELQDDYLNSEI